MQAVLGKRYEVRYIPPPKGKDYNDYLKIIKEAKTQKVRKEKGGDSDQKR